MRSLPSLDDIRQGGKLALSRMLTRLETEADTIEIAGFLDEACASGSGRVLGLTGPPGVGKSTLTDALIRHFRSLDLTVAVLAIDPSSQFTGGALLGDRTRLQTDPDDTGTFVRSMAARDRLGGLSDHAIAAISLLRAVVDRVIVESVGIGQSEGDLVRVCDTLVLCIQPGSGDSLQFMKAGIMELPDVVAVTKADMGAAARRAASDVAGALTLSRQMLRGWHVPVCEVSARTGQGMEDLVSAVSSHAEFLDVAGELLSKRLTQQGAWLRDMVRARFGSAGIEAVDVRLSPKTTTPFSTYLEISEDLGGRLRTAVPR